MRKAAHISFIQASGIPQHFLKVCGNPLESGSATLQAPNPTQFSGRPRCSNDSRSETGNHHPVVIVRIKMRRQARAERRPLSISTLWPVCVRCHRVSDASAKAPEWVLGSIPLKNFVQ